MNKFSSYGKISFYLFLFLSMLLLFSLMGDSSLPPVWGNTPSLKAVLASDEGRIELSWEPYPGAVAYLIFRAPAAAVPYKFSLLQELPGSQTLFTDDPGKYGSFVYQVAAVGGGDYVYPLAARLADHTFAGLLPVSLRFHPNTVDNALSSLDSYDRVQDANSGEYLGGSSEIRVGMVLKVDGFSKNILYQTGTMPGLSENKFAAHKYKLFAVPLAFDQLRIKDLQILGLKGSASFSFVFSDGNNQQMTDSSPLLPGWVYGTRFDRPTEINFLNRMVRQGSPVARPKVHRPQLLGGSPDDGTLVVVLYDDSYQTKLYKCWSSGKSGAWDGITDNAAGADNVKNAAVVRRGCAMYVKDEAGMSDTTPVTVYAPAAPGSGRQTVGWSISWNSGLGAAAVQIPATAKVGDYQVRVGTDPENYVTVYIIFDPSFASGALDANEWRSWVYVDDDWQTVPDLKNYLNYVFQGPGYPLSDRKDDVYGYRGDWDAESGAHGGVFGERWVEMACAIHGSGAADPMEACIHAYQVIGQRITWVSGNGWYGNDSGEYNTFDDTLIGTIEAPQGGGYADELDVATAEQAALGLGWSSRLPANYVLDAGACFNFGTCLAAMFRALGIPARAQHSIGGDGWTSSFHVWAEAYLDNPEAHPQDANWWDSFWYEFDCNDPYYSTTHTTSHSEGSISPIVICGYGDYLINEYIQCEGIGYDGSFYDNSFECTPPGTDTGTHTAVPLQNGTTNDAEEDDSTPLVVEYDTSANAWQLLNLFVPYDGPAAPSGDPYVYDSHHGYALNDTQTGPSGGSGYIADSTNENDLPVLLDSVDQRGVIAGWGFMMYRIPVAGRDSITVELTEGADKVEILACLDRNIFSTDRRWDLDYDFISDVNGELTAATSGGDQLYLWLQLQGFSQSNPGNGQEVAWYTIRVIGSAPYVSAQYSYANITDLQLQFTDESEAFNDTIVSWYWDFGDGEDSTEQNPVHTFPADNYYDVTLTVTGASSAEDSETKTIWVGGNQSPTADFTYSVNGLSVEFSDASSDPDGYIASWSWNFGDGDTSSAQNPVHTYTEAGTYTVSLTVTDNGGLPDDTTQDVLVDGSTPPTAGFIFSVDGLTVMLSDQSSDADGTVTGWSWDFGDGGTSTARNVGHTFPAAGTYSVMLTVVDNDGLEDTIPQDVTVSSEMTAPDADFSFSVDGSSATFTDDSLDPDPDGSIVSWSWDFGDGGSSNDQNPSHSYAEAGTYSVELTVTDDDGLTGFIAKDVTVSGGSGLPAYCPSASSSADNMAINKVQIGSFVNTSGKSTYSDFTNLTINMQQGGNYNVKIYMDNRDITAYVRMWIDFNRDGDFDDAGEQVFQKARKYRAQGSISIPTSGVVTGQKLGLRIHCDDAAYRNPCDNGIGNGEVEDYAVIIQ